MGLVQFQIVPCPSLYFSRSIGTFPCSRCLLQGFILLHLSLPKQFPLFILASCLLVSSVSNFRRHKGAKVVTYLGSLVQSCCGEGGPLQTSITGVCGERLQCLGHTGFAPAHSVCALPVYTAQAPGWSARELSKAGPGLRTLLRSKPLRFRISGTPQRHRLGWACVLCPSQV